MGWLWLKATALADCQQIASAFYLATLRKGRRALRLRQSGPRTRVTQPGPTAAAASRP